MLGQRLFLLLVMTFFATSALASTADLDRAVMKSMRLSQQSLSPAERKDIARQSLAYWKSFDSRVPRNSPADAEWLSKELSTSDSTRLGRAINTPQFALYQLAFLGSNCVDLFEKLVPAVGSDRFLEAYFWLKTVQCYARSEQTVRQLQQAGLSNGNYDGPINVQHFGLLMDLITGKIANSIAAD